MPTLVFVLEDGTFQPINCITCKHWKKVSDMQFSPNYGHCSGMTSGQSQVDINLRSGCLDNIETYEDFGCANFEKIGN